MENLKLATKFNLVLILALTVGLILTGYFSYSILASNARAEVVARAGLMMESAAAIRGYTISEIRPLLARQSERVFLPQTVPAYAATQSFHKLQESNPDYTYKEATLNPTNPRDRAVDWEADIIEAFVKDSDTAQVVGERDKPTGRSLYLARPIRIKSEACLVCHSTITAAPEAMIARYGTANGFGWKLDEIVGAQIVSVPMSVPIEQANAAFVTFMGSLAAVFVVIVVLLNLMLRSIVIRPITQMASVVDKVSTGEEGVADLQIKGSDEVAVLGAAFNRMRRSLEKAVKMLEE